MVKRSEPVPKRAAAKKAPARVRVGRRAAPDTVVKAVAAELKAMGGGAAGSALGQLALRLAATMDDPATLASARAGCARELRGCLAELRASSAAGPKRDALDELKARRERRATGRSR